jgi:hypothetical protein
VRRQGDQERAKDYGTHASDILARIEQAWGAEAYQKYYARPDIQHSRTQLAEIFAGKQ